MASRHVDYLSDTLRNPFGMDPSCERFVPGYGPTDADFHVVGDNPALHGGLETGIPFTDRSWSAAFFDALVEGGIVDAADTEVGDIDPGLSFFSYLHTCDPGEDPPTTADYADLEGIFDAELRAITAHVLVPVGGRATKHVLDTYTARSMETVDMDALHANEVRGSGWLVVPLKDPAEWTAADADRVVACLQTLLTTGYEQTSDLGRFLPGEEPYLVR